MINCSQNTIIRTRTTGFGGGAAVDSRIAPFPR